MADVITRLRLDSREYDAKIERARSGLVRLSDELNRAGKSFKDADADQIKYVQSLGQMPTVAKTAKGAIAELTKAYTDLSLEYKKLSAEDKNSASGRGLKTSLDELRTRIQAGKKDLADISTELNDTGKSANNLQGVLGTLGSKFGISTDLMSGLTTGTIAYTAAIGAAATAVTAAAKALAEYNTELAQQDNATSVVTGLKGGDADSMTSMARALSKTYDVDFRQSIEAANTLMSQFGVTSAEAMKLLRDGMQGMIQGDGPKLLSMIQQFAPSFQSAGVSAAQLVAVIQNSEGGIFTDQNMQAIVMGIKNIRLMTNSTSEALAKLGIDGKKMSEQLNDGSLTIFQALRQVSDAITGVGTGSQAAGEVMQQVFGRQGASLGTNLGKAIATLNTNLEDTKTQTGELGKSYADLEAANERLNRAIRDCFEYDGWEAMTIGLKTGLVTALAAVAEKLGEIKGWLTSLETAGVKEFDFLRERALASLGPLGQVLNMLVAIGKAKNAIAGIGSGGDAGSALGAAIGTPTGSGTQNPAAAVLASTGKSGKAGGANKTEPTIEGGLKGLKELDGEALHVTESMKSLREQLSNYRKAAENADNPMDYARAQQGIADTQARIKAQPMALKLGLDTDSMMEVQSELESFAEQLRAQIQPIKVDAAVDTKTFKLTSEEATKAASAISSIGSALQSIEDPGAKVAGIIATAIGNIALTFASSLKGTVGPWDWIAAAAAGTATMITTIESIKSATKGGFAQGGIVPGNHFSGDLLNTQNYGINSGELVLTRAQQGNLASQLEGNPLGNLTLDTFISAEDIQIVLNNRGKRTGRGEYVQSKKMR